MLVYFNGAYVPHERACVSVDDRGFLFGDGVYEVTRALDGRLVDHERHARRLAHSLAGVELAPAGLDAGAIREIAERLLAENGLTRGHATVYLQVTRGAARGQAGQRVARGGEGGGARQRAAPRLLRSPGGACS